ncbi:hypothetical protein OPKNFCMD_4771 [Methylobacterium crusticola]|uniref:Uncharacterized protein n=1 Tax=Methylobacterium crusticola TaxID=1697972 RepID=A0ABQ4R5D2_9HYPH|nr:hypothetical protein [Methylobacterium crusticola]GJD52009.1 hypothetical protein OPKNFCMD_4771 [Methylobacterium crusticola]
MPKRPALALLLLALPLPALAQAGGAPHASHAAPGPNGGRIAEAGRTHVELVARGAALELFLTGADAVAPVPADGFRATAILVVDGRPARIALVPAGGNRLSGTAPLSLPPRPRGAVQLTGPDGATASARFD